MSFGGLTMLNYYKNNKELIIATTLRHKGLSKASYDSLNMAYYVGDNAEDVLNNRLLIANEIQLPLTRWVFPKITHSTNIYKVTSQDLGKGAFDEASSIFNVDGLYTDLHEVVLSVFHADCIPFVFYDPKKKLIGVVHAGWKGTISKIVDVFLEKWISLEQCDPSDVEVIIGPSLSPKNFQVKKDVIDQVKEEAPEFLDYLEFNKDQSALFDAVKMNVLLMKNKGVLESNITINQECTYDLSNKYFSFRRDNTTGRHITFAVLK